MKPSIDIYHAFGLTFASYIRTAVMYPLNNITIPFLVCISIVLICLFIKKHPYKEILDIDATNQMRGLAILIIILYHFTTKVFLPGFKYYSLFDPLGEMGVGLFYILSGFGLMRSFMMKGFEKKYLVKKYLRVILPYTFVTLLWVFLDATLLHLHHSPAAIIENIFGIVITASYITNVDPFMWYITYLLFLYVVFYAVFRLKIHVSYKICLLFLVNIVVYLIHPLLLKKGLTSLYYWNGYALCFPLGVSFALYYDPLKKQLQKLSMNQQKVLIGTIFLTFLTFGIHHSWIWGFVIILFVMGMTLFSIASRFLLLLGTFSYELYLLHGPLMLRYDFFFFKFPLYSGFIMYFLLILGLAFLLKYGISDYIYGKILFILKRRES